MTLVAEYRADQLTYNYSHDTADKREALAYYEYGRWIDATIVGLDPSESYYEADTTEAICAGFDGTTTEGFDKFNMGYGNKIEILNDDGRRVVYAHLSEILVKQGDRVDNDTIIGKTGCSGGSRVPHLHIEIRKTNSEETGLDYTINPLEVLPKLDFSKINLNFELEPYATLWNKMASETEPWNFCESDVWYRENSNYIS